MDNNGVDSNSLDNNHGLAAKIRLGLLALLWIACVGGGLFLHHRDVTRYQSWSDAQIKVIDVEVCKSWSRRHVRSYTCGIQAEFVYNDQSYHYMFNFWKLEDPPYASEGTMIPAKFYVDGDQVIVDFPGRYLFLRILLILAVILLPFYTGYRAYQFKKEGLL